MADFIPLQSTAARFGGGTGRILEGVGRGIEEVTPDLLKRLERRKTLDIFASHASPEERAALSTDPNLFYSALQSGYGAAQQQPQQNQQPSPVEQLASVLTPEQLQKVKSLPPAQQQQIIQAASQIPRYQQQVQQQEQRPSEQINPFAPKASPQIKSPFVGNLQEQKLTLAQEKQQQAKQAQIERKNKPFVDNVYKLYQQSQNVKADAETLLGYLDTGEINPGIWSGIGGEVPSFLQGLFLNNTEQKYVTKLNELIKKLDALEGGRGSNYKTQLTKASKPNIGQSIKSQREILEDLVKKADKDSRPYEETQNIIEQSGQEPKNLSTEVFKRLKLDNPESQSKQLQAGQTIDKITPEIVASMAEGGTLRKNGKVIGTKINGQFVRAK
jgi:hypothetical protein